MASLHHLQDLVGHFGGHDFKNRSPYLRSSANRGSMQRRKVPVLVGKLSTAKKIFVYLKQ